MTWQISTKTTRMSTKSLRTLVSQPPSPALTKRRLIGLKIRYHLKSSLMADDLSPGKRFMRAPRVFYAVLPVACGLGLWGCSAALPNLP